MYKFSPIHIYFINSHSNILSFLVYYIILMMLKYCVQSLNYEIFSSYILHIKYINAHSYRVNNNKKKKKKKEIQFWLAGWCCATFI